MSLPLLAAGLVLRQVGSAAAPTTNSACVRRVDFSEAPEMKELAKRAEQIANGCYPGLVELLDDGTTALPRCFDIVFKQKLGAGHAAVTIRERRLFRHPNYVIVLSAAWLKSSVTNSDLAAFAPKLDAVLVHEMAHVAQLYPKAVPSYWREGIAEYACWKLGRSTSSNCLQCSAKHPHYKSGYACAAALLVFIEENYQLNIVRLLNAELRRGSYSDALFVKATGKTLAQLWAEFQQTPRFTPLAADLDGWFETLGIATDADPAGFEQRAEEYLSGGLGDPPSLEARRHLATLCWQRGQLPGWSKTDRGEMTTAVPRKHSVEGFPITRTFRGQKDGDCFIYEYTLMKLAPDNPWKLVRARRIGPEGQVAEEYPVAAIDPPTGH